MTIAEAKKLGRTPTMGEIRRMTKIRDYLIRFHYTNLGNALREAGLEPRGGGHRVNLVKLFEDWAQLTRRLGHPPTALEYRRGGSYGMNTLVKRCGSWRRIGMRFRALVDAERKEREWRDVLEIIEQWKGKTTAAARLDFITTMAPSVLSKLDFAKTKTRSERSRNEDYRL